MCRGYITLQIGLSDCPAAEKVLVALTNFTTKRHLVGVGDKKKEGRTGERRGKGKLLKRESEERRASKDRRRGKEGKGRRRATVVNVV